VDEGLQQLRGHLYRVLHSCQHTESSSKPTVRQSIDVVQDVTINGLFECAADATEEAIYNALCMAKDTVGPRGLEVKAINQDRLKVMVEKHVYGVR